MEKIPVMIEHGEKRTFASAVDWPGWSRSGKREEAALQALAAYGPRYGQVLEATRLDFRPPEDGSAFLVVERSKGDATTDFGAPGVIPEGDKEPVEKSDHERLVALLQACWAAFDRAALAAQGKELRKGPRGGGRDLDKITEHVLGADQAYLYSLGWKLKKGEEQDLQGELKRTREAVLHALEAAIAGELPREGPRGGKRWPPRYFVRRSAWHVLDHTWEIEDRLME